MSLDIDGTSPASIRELRSGDEALLDAFLLQHPNTTMFLRGNSARGGLTYEGKALQGNYVAAFVDGAIVGVVAHWWRGNLCVESPLELLGELVRATLQVSGRSVTGLVGTCAQLDRVREALNWSNAEMVLESCEILYRIELDALLVPAALEDGEHLCRVAKQADMDLLVNWRVAYSVEALGMSPETAMKPTTRESLERAAKSDSLYVLEAGGSCVAMTAFNTRTSDCVQVGGVWTPPSLRSNGYARSAVAGSLLAARTAGATSSILFTEEDNYAAQACYGKLGYQVVGDYALMDFAEAQNI